MRGEVLRRFDFRCCDSIEEFNDISRLALTENRHVKFNSELHKKDDRAKTVNPRYFVLGWDNTEKKRRIAERIEQLEKERQGLNKTIADHDRRISELGEVVRAAVEALQITDFDSIDVQRHTAEITALENERRELEEANDTVKALRERLSSEASLEQQLDEARTEQIGDQRRTGATHRTGCRDGGSGGSGSATRRRTTACYELHATISSRLRHHSASLHPRSKTSISAG